MLTALKLGNFKAFAETQTIPLRPLTLIFGPNSSGKSTIIHGLLFAHEANRTGSVDVRRMQRGGDCVDLGGFQQFLHLHSGGPLSWEASLDAGAIQSRSGGWHGNPGEISVSLGVGTFPSTLFSWQRPAVQSYAVAFDGKPLMTARSEPDPVLGFIGPEKLKLKQIDVAHPVFSEFIERSRSRKGKGDRRSMARSRTRREASLLTLLDHLDLHVDGFLPTQVQAAKRVPQRSQTLDLLATVIRDLLVDMRARVSAELERLSYLGPMRTYPQRGFLVGEIPESANDPNWVAGGGRAYEILVQDADVRNAVNAWLGNETKLSTPYELEVEDLLSSSWVAENLDTVPGFIGEAVREQLESAFKSLSSVETSEAIDRASEIAQASASRIVFGALREQRGVVHKMLLRDKRTKASVSHRDVGIGVSQVLPVLVNAFGSENRMIAIEQPEIHLHPALQAELADVFIESALGQRKNMFILETHSEHLILRVMRRMRDTVCGKRRDAPPVTPADVAILFVEPTANGSIVRELRLKPDGTLIDPWPGGFFEESFGELFG